MSIFFLHTRTDLADPVFILCRGHCCDITYHCREPNPDFQGKKTVLKQMSQGGKYDYLLQKYLRFSFLQTYLLQDQSDKALQSQLQAAQNHFHSLQGFYDLS